MSSIQLNDAANLGNAKLAVQGLIDTDIANTLRMYKRQVVKRYRAITPAEFDLCLGMGNLLVSPKIDGELWFLVFAEDGVFLTNPAKLVIAGDFPVLLEAQAIAPNLTPGTIVAGELYAKGGAGRPRVGDLAAAMGGGKSATIDKIGFTAFDLVMGGDCEINVLTASSYSSRLEMLRRHFSSGKRLQAIKTENICDRAGLEMLWSEWVENGNGEGLVARSAQGTIFKIKPDIRLDVVVVAYTETSTAPPMVRSLLLGLMTDAGQVQVIGGCSSIGSDEFRQQLLRQLQAIDTASHYRYASDSGVLYRFVRPEQSKPPSGAWR
jgi:ATP-dependent DNA ligase